MEHPWNFLGHVSMPNSRQGVCVRRAIVLRFLNAEYSPVHRNKAFKQAKEECKKDGIEASEEILQCDAAVYRNAFRYLNASPEEQERVRRDSKGLGRMPFFGVKCLIAAGITGWDQLKPPTPESSIAPAQLIECPAPQQAVVETEQQQGPREPEETVLVPQGTLVELNRTSELLARTLQELLIENEILGQRLSRQESEVARLLALVEHTKIMRLGELAEHFPDVPKLFTLAQMIEQQRYAAPEGIPEDLPQKTRAGKSVTYAKSFLKFLRTTEDELRKQTVEALRQLSEQGQDYTGLDTKPYKGNRLTTTADAKMFTSRVSREWRLLWYWTNGTLRICGLHHHADLYRRE